MTMNTPVHALLLAAGFGTRLRPLTLTKPKCLVEINGEPLLERWLQQLEACGCTQTIVNTHYLADQVKALIDNRRQSRMIIECKYERELLGTAGTLTANRNLFKGSVGLLIHADNVTGEDLNKLLQAHASRPEECLITMLTFDSEDPSKCGIVEIDKDNIVTGFHEKVKDPPGKLANGAVYVFDESLFQWIDGLGGGAKDFSTEVIPSLVGKIYTWKTDKAYIDIGTYENLKRARRVYSDTGKEN